MRVIRLLGLRIWLLVAAGWFVATGCARRQPEPEPVARTVNLPEAPPKADGPLDVHRAVAAAQLHAPSIRTARARVDLANAGTDLADTAYLPRLDLVWQEIRATRNNISGTTFPQGVLPAISGPVGASRSWSSGWGSNAGALLTYEPLDFGLRSATVEAARLAARQAEADVRVTRLEAGATAAEAFLAHLAARQTLRTTRANLDRWEVFAKSVHALTDRELRPGADASRADAEVAAARTQDLLAEQTVQTSRIALAESMGTTELPAETDAGPLLDLPPSEIPPGDPAGHPLLDRQAAAVQSARARQDALDRAFAPRLNLLLGVSGRGSGFDPAGNPEPSDGLFPTRPNWGAGVSLTFGVTDYFQLSARRLAEEGAERAERARADEIYLSLRMQSAKVRTVLDTARKIADNTRVQLQAANDAVTRARSRYDTGLGTLTEVADAQRLLAQAEIDELLARLTIWRTLAASARVRGDLEPFLKLVAAAQERKK
jgi:outer membrane protein TolC